MAGELVTGPAGAGKSAIARQILAALAVAGIILDFQSLYAALLGLERGPDGRYPERLESDAHALRVAEYMRRAAITAAQADGLYAVVTNSDGSPQRRSFLLNLLGDGASERIVDPGREVVEARLSVGGQLSDQCRAAIERYYSRLGTPDVQIRAAVGDAELETFLIELRQEASQLLGVLVQEGRAATGGRRELFAPGAVEWLASGVDILPEHRAGAETKVTPARQADGRITFSTPLTPALRAAWDAGRRFMSVEFHAMAQKTAGGIREIQRALVVAGAMTDRPEYDTATAEIRSEISTLKPSRGTLWL